MWKDVFACSMAETTAELWARTVENPAWLPVCCWLLVLAVGWLGEMDQREAG